MIPPDSSCHIVDKRIFRAHLPAPMADRPLTDNQVHDRLCKAHEALGDGQGLTPQGEAALQAARKVLKLIQYGLVGAMVRVED